MKFALIAFLISNITLAKSVTDQFQCKLNYEWTKASYPEIAKVESSFRAKIEINHENLILTSFNKFKFVNISSLENKKYKYLKSISNDKNEIVLKDIKVDINNDSNNVEYVYHTNVNEVQVYFTTMYFTTWSLQFKDPKKENDFLVYIDCKRSE